MIRPIDLYRYFHFLSLDIVLGALATSCLAACLFRSDPGWAWWVSLALTVWLLYMGDHVLDAWRQRKLSKRELHLFIFRNRRVILWMMGVAGIADIFLILNLLDRTLLKYALLLGAMVLLFYAIRHVLRRNRVFFIPGEIFVMILYLAGTWLGPFVARTEILQPVHGMIAVMMCLVLWMNLGIISLFDVNLDTRLGISSLAYSLGNRITRNLMLGAAAGILLLAVLQFLVYGTDRYSHFALILLGMTVVLMLVLLMPSLFRNREAFRLVADAVLYMGFLSLIIP